MKRRRAAESSGASAQATGPVSDPVATRRPLRRSTRRTAASGSSQRHAAAGTSGAHGGSTTDGPSRARANKRQRLHDQPQPQPQAAAAGPSATSATSATGVPATALQPPPRRRSGRRRRSASRHTSGSGAGEGEPAASAAACPAVLEDSPRCGTSRSTSRGTSRGTNSGPQHTVGHSGRRGRVRRRRAGMSDDDIEHVDVAELQHADSYFAEQAAKAAKTGHGDDEAKGLSDGGVGAESAALVDSDGDEPMTAPPAGVTEIAVAPTDAPGDSRVPTPLSLTPPLAIQLRRHHSETLVCRGAASGPCGEGPSAAEESRRATTQVLSWGRGEEGQLMHAAPGNMDAPHPVAKFEHYRVVDISLAPYHAIAVTEDGQVFASGANDEGQIFSDRETTQVLAPVMVENLSSQRVLQVSAGMGHSACLLASKTVVTFGFNEYGQCGHSKDKPFRVPPRIVTGLGATKIVQVACGELHTLLLSSYGEVFSFGCGAQGVLGHSDRENKMAPTRIEALSTIPVTQISAGNSHSAAVTVTGSAYTWGRNKHGRLGVSASVVEHASYVPIRVKRLPVDVQQTACGGSHTVFVGKGGELFVAGRGHNGCLGLGEPVDAQFEPVAVPTFKDVRVRAAACGQNHTLILTADGNVWGMGSNNWGQLGLGPDAGTGNFYTPVQVPGLENAGTFHIAAGGDSSVAIRVVRGSVLSRPAGTLPKLALHGISASGLVRAALSSKASAGFEDLIRLLKDLFSHPAALNASFLKGAEEQVWFRDTGKEGEDEAGAGPAATGGDEEGKGVDSTAPTQAGRSAAGGEDTVEVTHPTPPPAAAVAAVAPAFGAFGDTSAAAAAAGAGGVGRSAAGAGAGAGAGSGAASFSPASSAKAAEVPATPRGSRLTSSSVIGITTAKGTLVRVTGTRLQTSHLDIAGLEQAYKAVFNTHDPRVITTLCRAIEMTLAQLSDAASTLRDPDSLRVFLVLLMNPLNGLPKQGNILRRLCQCIISLPSQAQGTLLHWIGQDVPKALFASRLVRPLQKSLSAALAASQAQCSPLICMLFMLNKLNQQLERVNYSEFHNATASSVPDQILMADYQRWRRMGARIATQGPGTTFCLCEYPFLMDADAKRRVLRCEAHLQMTSMVNSQMATIMMGMSPYLVLQVTRSRLMDSALNQLSSMHPHQLKKPLKVVFAGEEGIDEGGVKKEFFQLLVRDMFDVKYGMFTYNEDTRHFFFRQAQFDMDTLVNNFRLVGVVLGLAIYNGVILDVHFPRAVYRKMLGKTMTMDDLKEVQPVIASSLQAILDYEGDDAEDVFCLDFTASYETFGEEVTVDLLPGGKDIPVTSENKEDYVEKYVEWALESSIATQFRAFLEGFLLVLDGPSLHLFDADDLELLVCGTPHLDFKALREATVYDGGFDNSTPAIRWFWEIVEAWDLDKRSKLLLFATGCAKAPIGGLGKLNFKIQRNGGPETNRLPTAATCFNTLLLPEYRSKAFMRERLEVAIQECEGFGLK